MCRPIPFAKTWLALLTQMVFGCNLHDSPALALEATPPRLNVMHPGALHGGEVHPNACMVDPPRSHVFPMMRPAIVADELNGLHGCRNRVVSMVQNRGACLLPLPCRALPIDLAGRGIEGGQEMEGTSTRIVVLVSVG